MILRFPSLSSLVLPSFRFFLDFRLLGRRHDSGGEYLNTGQYERIYIYMVCHGQFDLEQSVMSKSPVGQRIYSKSLSPVQLPFP